MDPKPIGMVPLEEKEEILDSLSTFKDVERRWLHASQEESSEQKGNAARTSSHQTVRK